MIKEELEQLHKTATEAELVALRNRTVDIYMIGTELQDCKTSSEVVPFILAELTGPRRASVINRMYGRYRKLLPTEDLRYLHQWKPKN